jgi:hypothetical protein
MKTFLRSPKIRTPAIHSAHAPALKSLRLTRNYQGAFVVPLLLCALATSMDAQAGRFNDAPGLTIPADASASRRVERKRLVTLRRNEMPEGSRFTFTSDSPLDDYRSFTEGERVCVMIPQAAFVSQRRDETGRGFMEMRIEQRDESVKLSFRLQPGASVAVNQNFNRLEIVFMTNERANSARPN